MKKLRALKPREDSVSSALATADYASTPILLLAVWLGLAAWVGELASIIIRKYAFGILHYLNPASILLGPFAYLICFVVAGSVLFVLHRVASRMISRRVVTGILCVLAAAGVVGVYSKWLGSVASVILALGIGIQATRVIDKRPLGFRRLVRSSVAPMAIFSVLLGASATGYGVLRERRALAGLPAARGGTPNVIIIILDTVRAASLSLYGYIRPTTPELERLALTGARFDNAIATASWTVPSHAGIFTAQFPTELRTEYDKPMLPTSHATIAEVLRDNGYQTAGFVANLYYLNREFGFARGFTHYEDYAITPGQLVLSFSLGRMVTNSKWYRRATGHTGTLNYKDVNRLNNDLLSWLEKRDRSRPFFAFLNYYDAHEPYLPPEPFHSRFAIDGPLPEYEYHTDAGERARDRNLPPEEIRPQIGLYDGALAFLDNSLGQPFRELERQGLSKNTVLIVTSDHGEEFGEHGLMGHAHNVYLPAIHVPLIVSFPGRVPAGASVRHPVSLRDIPATVLDLAGLAGSSDFAGRSLARFWRAPSDSLATADPMVFSAVLADWRSKSLVAGRYHYIKFEKKEELYDIVADPWEQTNLVAQPESRLILEAFRERFARVPRSKK